MRFTVLISEVLVNVAMAILLLMALHVAGSVGLRWITGRDIPLTLEITSAYYMVALTFLPLAAIDLTQSHIRAEFLSAFLSRRANYVLGIVIRVLMFLFLVLMTWRTTLNAINRTENREEMITILGQMAVWPARWFVPFGFLIAAIAAAILIARAFGGRDTDPVIEVDDPLRNLS